MISEMSSSTQPMSNSGQPPARIKQKLKSMGVPDEVIAKGKQAVMAWMRENRGPQKSESTNDTQSAAQDTSKTKQSGNSNVNLQGSQIDIQV